MQSVHTECGTQLAQIACHTTPAQEWHDMQSAQTECDTRFAQIACQTSLAQEWCDMQLVQGFWVHGHASTSMQGVIS